MAEPDAMECEARRLCSFPAGVPITLATASAAAGLYYVSGTCASGLLLRCFSCEIEFFCSPDHNPLSEHMLRSNSCRFLQKICRAEAAEDLEVNLRECTSRTVSPSRGSLLSRHSSFSLDGDTVDLADDQEMRLITFESPYWPSDCAADKEELAAAGFYFTGSDDTIKCFSCCLSMHVREAAADPFEEHRRLSPDCCFISSLICGPAFQLVDERGMIRTDPHYDDTLMHHEQHRRATYGSYPERAAGILPPSALARAGFYYTSFRDVSRCTFCHVTLRDLKRGDFARRLHRHLSPFCPLVLGKCQENVTVDQDLLKEGMERESLRFESFCTWPKHLGLSAGELAAAGFYYSGAGDRVTCFSCMQSLRDWSPEHDAVSRHREIHVQCPFMSGTDTKNVPLEYTAEETPANFEDEVARLKSFRNWPEQIGVAGDDLAYAGYYYTGTGDVVRCPFCGGEARHWRDSHSAFERHKIHSPDCPFVRDHCPPVAGGPPVAGAVMSGWDTGVVGDESVLTGQRHSVPDQAAAVLHRTLPVHRLSSTLPAPSPRLALMQRSVSCHPGPVQTDIPDAEQELEKLKASRTCVVCLDSEASHIFSPCCHLVCCGQCADALATCPMCQQVIEKCTRVFFP